MATKRKRDRLTDAELDKVRVLTDAELDKLDPEDHHDAWWVREQYRRREENRAIAKFGAEVKRAFKSKGAYKIRSQFPYNGMLIIHRSTRPGVAYQVSEINDEGPTGHADASSLDAAIKRAWEDVNRTTKKRFFTKTKRNAMPAKKTPKRRARKVVPQLTQAQAMARTRELGGMYDGDKKTAKLPNGRLIRMQYDGVYNTVVWHIGPVGSHDPDNTGVGRTWKEAERNALKSYAAKKSSRSQAPHLAAALGSGSSSSWERGRPKKKATKKLPPKKAAKKMAPKGEWGRITIGNSTAYSDRSSSAIVYKTHLAAPKKYTWGFAGVGNEAPYASTLAEAKRRARAQARKWAAEAAADNKRNAPKARTGKPGNRSETQKRGMGVTPRWTGSAGQWLAERGRFVGVIMKSGTVYAWTVLKAGKTVGAGTSKSLTAAKKVAMDVVLTGQMKRNSGSRGLAGAGRFTHGTDGRKIRTRPSTAGKKTTKKKAVRKKTKKQFGKKKRNWTPLADLFWERLPADPEYDAPAQWHGSTDDPDTGITYDVSVIKDGKGFVWSTERGTYPNERQLGMGRSQTLANAKAAAIAKLPSFMRPQRAPISERIQRRKLL